MGLLFYDGFEGYSVESDLQSRWLLSGGGEIRLVTGRGGTGQGCYLLSRSLRPIIPRVMTSCTIGFGLMGGSEGILIAGYYPGYHYDYEAVVYLHRERYSRRFYLFGPNLRPIGGQTAPATGDWNYVEMYLSQGYGYYTVRLRINSELMIDTGIVPGGSAPPGVNYIVFSGTYSTIDDVYIAEGEDFLGDGRGGILVPNGAGASTEWLPSTPGADNWDMVNSYPGFGADSVYTETTEALDLWSLQDPPGMQQLKGAAYHVVAGSDPGASDSYISQCYILDGELFESEQAYVDPYPGQRVIPLPPMSPGEDGMRNLMVGVRRTA